MDYIKQFENNVFSYDSKLSTIEEKNLGICSDISSLITPEYSVSAMKCFQGCPYTNTAFLADVFIDGERVKCTHWKWLPNAILREGQAEIFSVKTITAMIPAQRGVVQKIIVTNHTPASLDVPMAIFYRGRTRMEESWQFSIPKAEFENPEQFSLMKNYFPERGSDSQEYYSFENEILSSVKDGTAYRMTCSLPDITMFKRAYRLEGNISVPPNGTMTFYVSAHMGEENASLAEAQNALGNYEKLLEQSFSYLETETNRIYNMLPRLSSDNQALDKLYYRSLVTYILCRWENPDLCTIPFFSTGSVNGSCMCSYLWDYCGGLMMHPIYDPEGNKKQLLAYLRNDLTKSYALNPVTSGMVGPWYQINQEKIILMVYHHIRATGDKDFLFMQAGERTVIEWMLYHAYVCDDVSKDVELYDYGEGGNDHLEIYNWGNGPYNGIIPDLNARRYQNYMLVYELTVLAGQPDEELPKRAAALKEKLKVLWNEKEKWYDFIDTDGNRDTRYTIQMFKFLNSGVIDKKERDGLVSHINEKEFLSKYGIHSMSKTDPQYDQDDCDNGGGGTCTHFAMQVCAQLYETGYDKVATDVLNRTLWWGARTPYLGDSCLSNIQMVNNRTPLHGDISSVSCAQMIFFYIFGITPHFDGSITICPVKNRPASNMKVDNVRLCGKIFSVDINGDHFTVSTSVYTKSEKIGQKITL